MIKSVCPNSKNEEATVRITQWHVMTSPSGLYGYIALGTASPVINIAHGSSDLLKKYGFYQQVKLRKRVIHAEEYTHV